jgi:hypothetical protein
MIVEGFTPYFHAVGALWAGSQDEILVCRAGVKDWGTPPVSWSQSAKCSHILHAGMHAHAVGMAGAVKLWSG